ncbi:MAG: hypothetical protein JWO30_1391 [Fibrobacteres bacterium]|nr:hypothetical protein [Fibrobacterota bacterium]
MKKKPWDRFAGPPRSGNRGVTPVREKQTGLAALSAYARALCRSLMRQLPNLDPSRIRRKSPPHKEGE